MKKLIALSLMVSLLLTVGCNTVYKTVITVTQVRNTVMNELGRQYRLGKIDAATDKKIADADKAYRDAAAVAQSALEAYKVSGQGDPKATILAVKNTVTVLIDVLATYQNASAQYKALNKATNL